MGTPGSTNAGSTPDFTSCLRRNTLNSTSDQKICGRSRLRTGREPVPSAEGETESGSCF